MSAPAGRGTPRALRVVVVGAGFGGVGMAARLREAGVHDVVVVERADGFGGTWRANTYPGAACDVPAPLYSYSFAPGNWTRRFAGQDEILRYVDRVARDRGVDRLTRFGTEVRSLVLDEDRGVWRVTLGRAGGGPEVEVLEADVVVSAVGQLSRPVVPALPGLQDFAGPVWHSAQWRHDVDLTGRRVAVVGTGASAIQFVPEIAEVAAEVVVYQRTPPYVLPRPDKQYSPAYRRAVRAVPALQRAARLATYLKYESRALAFVTEPRLMGRYRRQWERLVERQLPDPVQRAAATPDHVMGCKRVLVSNDWYRTLRRDSVSVVTDPITRVTAGGVVTAAGTERPADAIVFGTGFASHGFLQPMEVVGRGGRTLREAWAEGAEAYLGTMVAGFPNLFLLYGPNTNLGHNSIVYMLESQFRYVLDALDVLRREGLAWLDVRPAAQQRWSREVARRTAGTVFGTGCSSWYTTESGRNTSNWPGWTFAYRRRTRRVDLADVEGVPRPAAGLPVA